MQTCHTFYHIKLEISILILKMALLSTGSFYYSDPDCQVLLTIERTSSNK